MNPLVHQHGDVAVWKVALLVAVFTIIMVADWYIHGRRPTGRSKRK